MYWNNPIQEIECPSDSDIIFKSQHGGQHCLFYDPAVPVKDIEKQTTLQGLCDWANDRLSALGRSNIALDPANHYDLANLVKINQMVHSLAKTGSVKPMLLHFVGRWTYATGTGDTRLRAIERVPQITTVSAIISTHERYRSRFAHLQEIQTLEDFARCFGTTHGQFLIRLTDPEADYGIDWYEYVLDDPMVRVPDWDFCLQAMQDYLQTQPDDFKWTVEWFDQAIDWHSHAGG